MKTYILTLVRPHKGTVDILGTFSKPKAARKAFDSHFGMDTKHKWKKITSGMRCYDNSYFITEYTLDTIVEE